jgi:tetratricopeptide (TPR) repeat protein
VTRIFRPILLAAASAAVFLQPLPAAAQMASLAGSYLAANQANYDSDYSAAAEYYTRALSRDPTNIGLMQNVLLATIAKGDVADGLAVARRMESAGAGSQLAQLVLLAGDIRNGDFAAAEAVFGQGDTFSPLLDGLVLGWINLGLGRMSDAAARFDEMGKNNAMKVFSDFHKALALASVGDFEAAEKIMQGENGQPLRLGRGSLIAHVKMLSQLERNDEAITMIDTVLNSSGDIEMLALRDLLVKGETLAYDFVTSPTEGVSEVFLTLASVLSNEENDRFGLVYGRLSEYLNPKSVAPILLVANMLNDQGQHHLAEMNFAKVPRDSPEFYNAEIGRAGALQAADKQDEAIEVLRELSETYPEIPAVFSALGDAMRRNSRFAEAGEAYSKSIALLGEPQPNQWFLFYARGITYEREGEWDAAEKDFRLALELSPDQPLVLNYLGYSLVEKRIKLDEAQKMIQVAVEKRPNDGYITDSLGWVFYRLGKFEEAVEPLERAVELEPVDPIINDHLGDAYWKVGRKLEAEFQWRRALSFDPEEKDAERIRLKLEIGLDEVLKSEADAN